MLRKLLYRILKSLPYSVIITVYLFKILNRLKETRKKKSGLVRVYIQPYNGHERICWILGDDSFRLSNLLKLSQCNDWMVTRPQDILDDMQSNRFVGVYPIPYAWQNNPYLVKLRRTAMIYDGFKSAKEGYRQVMSIVMKRNPDLVKQNNMRSIEYHIGSVFHHVDISPVSVSTPRNGTFVSQILK